MKIWGLKSVLDNYESFQLLNFEEDHKKYIDGKISSITHLTNSWGKIYIECIEGDNHSDFPKFWGGAGAPMISEKAKQVLEPLIDDNVEFLPLLRNSTSEVYYLVHVLNALDAIDGR